MRAPLLRIAIDGPSMIPTLAPGEWWVAVRTTSLRPGDLAVVLDPQVPSRILVKRAVRATPDGWWVEGDNAEASRDSRVFGPVPATHVVGRLRVRYRPLPVRWVRRPRG